jgi:CheY-like chemotaxis protein
MAYLNEQPSLRLSMLIIAAGTISTSLAQPDLLDLPIRRLLKEELGVSQSQMAMLFGIGALAWYAKPIAGLLVDSVLFGTHRRYYLIISSVVAAALWVFLGMVPHSYPLLLAGVVAMQCMLVIGSTVLGGFLVERGKRLMAEGRLVSCRMFVEHACDLVAGPLSGYLAGPAFGTAALIGAAIAVAAAPIAAICVTEPIQRKSTVVEARYLFSDIKSMLNSRTIWLVAIFSLIVSIPQSFGTPLYFYQKNTLAFTDVEIGYLTAVAGLGGLLGSGLYQFLCLHEEFEALAVENGSKGVQAAKAGRIDLVIMDVGFRDIDGREAVRILRKNGFKAPIIMLTGHDTDSDTILGLESGANDYVTKPFRFAVLLARIRAQLRQHEASEDAIFAIGAYTFRASSKLLLNPKGDKSG